MRTIYTSTKSWLFKYEHLFLDICNTCSELYELTSIRWMEPMQVECELCEGSPADRGYYRTKIHLPTGVWET